MLHDLVIAGAGPVGATLALAVDDADLDVVVVDARPEGGTLRGDRSLALSHGARLTLERLGVWTPLAAQPGAVTPIVDIDISQAHGFGTARLTAVEAGLPALGYVVRYLALQRTLDAELARRGIAVRWNARVRSVGGTSAYAAVDLEGAPDPLLARLAVVADGTGAVVAGLERRRHDYGESALVAAVWVDGAPPGLARPRGLWPGPARRAPGAGGPPPGRSRTASRPVRCRAT